MKLTYKQRILSYFVLVFIVYTAGIIILERRQEKHFRTEALESKLDGYVDFIHSYIITHSLTNNSIEGFEKLVDAMPKDVRITVIDNVGTVLFDKEVLDTDSLENHLNRLEIKSALYQSHGTQIRRSQSTNIEYLYYAKHFKDHYVRVALPYNLDTQNLLEADNYFSYITVLFFAIAMVFLYWIANQISRSILRLKKLTSRVKEGKNITKDSDFTDDEIGTISKELEDIFEQKEEARNALEAEREKLRMHFQYSEEGLGIFDAKCQKIYVNTHFIQYINLISDQPTLEANDLFEDDAFARVTHFLKTKTCLDRNYSIQINKNGKVFLVKVIVFEDISFELTIIDITKAEKNRILKQEITSNVAHELRTPVTALRGYLETMTTTALTDEKQKLFIDKAYLQSIRLSELIEDVSLLSKIDEVSESFVFETINLYHLVNSVRINLSDKLSANKVHFSCNFKPNLCIRGNQTLLYSIFFNLVDNSIKYAGKRINVQIDNYTEDNEFLYFSYYDTGKGVGEKHMTKLFERFYHVTEGRTRNTGGSGLGLSIVKNAIALHGGSIEAKKTYRWWIRIFIQIEEIRDRP